MVIQHNIQAMNANRMLNTVSTEVGKSTEKLSSGYRINRASDDAAGLSISEKMRKQIRGLSKASLNAEDGISCVQIADGALNEATEIVQRINQLCVQAANGTNSINDRTYIQDEVDQLVSELDRISETTKFNETYLLKGNNANGVHRVYTAEYSSTSSVTSNVKVNNLTMADLQRFNSYTDANGLTHYELTAGTYSFDNSVTGVALDTDGDVVITDSTLENVSFFIMGTDTLSLANVNVDNRNAVGNCVGGVIHSSHGGNATLNLYGNNSIFAGISNYNGMDSIAIVAENNSTLTINGSKDSNLSYGTVDEYGILVDEDCTITINSGNFTTNTSCLNSKGFSIWGDMIINGGNLTLSNKDYAFCLEDSEAYLQINGGTISTPNCEYAINSISSQPNPNKIEINGGSINMYGTHFPVLLSKTHLDINGGDILFSDEYNTPGVFDYVCGLESSSVLKINRGTFTAIADSSSTRLFNMNGSSKIYVEGIQKTAAEVAGTVDARLGKRVYTYNNPYNPNTPTFYAPDIGLETNSTDDSVLNNKKQLFDVDGNLVSEIRLQDYFDDRGNYLGGLYDHFDSTSLDALITAEDISKYVQTRSKDVNDATSLKIQAGADSDITNKVNISLDSMSATGLGLHILSSSEIGLVDTSGALATDAIDLISKALSKISTLRSALGAIQNRLDHTIKNLDNVVENTTASESQIRDTDMAKEMVAYSNNNVLIQAGQAMLAQANQSNSGVMSLL